MREGATLRPAHQAVLACTANADRVFFFLLFFFFLKAVAFMVLLHSSCQAAAEGRSGSPGPAARGLRGGSNEPSETGAAPSLC